MKGTLLRFGAMLAVLGAIGLLVAVSGIVPLKASEGHWPITEWFLQFGKQRSVSTYSMGTRVPDLEDPRLVLRGAGHYEGGCRPCHGGPGVDRWEPAEAMTPDPPPLSQRIDVWDDEELFFITKHGLKFTGMPAFPDVDRDDEVWSVVAFMLRLPGMRRHEYRLLAYGEPDAWMTDSADAEMPADALVQCARCHGEDGRGRAGAFPSLAGQSSAYLQASLEAYASGQRSSGIMRAVAEELDAVRMRELALRYGNMPASPLLEREPVARTDVLPVAATLLPPERFAEALENPAGAILRGEVIARAGIPDRKIPACIQCHGPAAWQRNPLFPTLAGQYADYIVLQLQLFHDERRGGSAYHHIMNTVARALTPDEMVDVALYYASLGR